MFEHVCIGTDGSECGTHAARVGIQLAEQFDASVTVVVAVDGELSKTRAESIADDVREIGAERRCTVQTQVVAGRAAPILLEVANEVDADAVVVGRRGHAGISERILGSTTDSILRQASVPVLTVPQAAPTTGYGTVLLTSDGSDHARAAIKPATTVAARTGAALHLLRVVDVEREAGPFDAGGVDQAYVDTLTDAAGEELDVFAAACTETLDLVADDEVGVNLERVVRTGTPAREIAAYVEEASIDMVAMSSVGAGTVSGRVLGSTTDRVLRLVDVPVLVVPHDR